jgi:hypothetical protein
MFMQSGIFCTDFRTGRGHVVGISGRVTDSAVRSQSNVRDISNDGSSFCLGMMVTMGSHDLI